tara:strand:+ start:861 stop:1154 length:294 start_codon:yes stop_codon:yes gene_type:complete
MNKGIRVYNQTIEVTKNYIYDIRGVIVSYPNTTKKYLNYTFRKTPEELLKISKCIGLTSYNRIMLIKAVKANTQVDHFSKIVADEILLYSNKLVKFT